MRTKIFSDPPVVEAARLCAAATAGQILVSDVVRLLARGKGHTFTPLGELTLKGLPEPVPASEVRWEPLAAGVPIPPRLATAPAIAMVGRAAELEVIARAYEAAKGGQRQIVLLAGEPGIGKTRLASEAALACHADGATVLLGTCDEDCNPPFGFACLRRVNESNVDLNRNFLRHPDDHVSSPDYDRLYAALNPDTLDDASEQQARAVLRDFVVEHGARRLQEVVSAGQYRHPRGLQFGGHRAEASNRIARQIVRDHVRGTPCGVGGRAHRSRHVWRLRDAYRPGPR